MSDAKKAVLETIRFINKQSEELALDEYYLYLTNLRDKLDIIAKEIKPEVDKKMQDLK